MKKLIPLLVFILTASVVLAVGPQGSDDSNKDSESQEQGQQQGSEQGSQGQQVQTEQQVQNQGEDTKIMTQQQTQLETQKLDEIEQGMQQKKQEMNQEMQQMGESQQNVYRNQNRVKLAADYLIAMEDALEEMGLQVSEIATEFNNSVQSTIKAEEKIQNRNRVLRFFIGGDKKTAEMIEQEVNNNLERIQELKQLKEECDCSDDVKAMLQEQIQSIEQEQIRLQELTQNEKEYQWLLGRFVEWMGGLF